MDRSIPARRVLLVQHGEKSSGPGDPGLTDRGRRQAYGVARVLADSGVRRVVSSPLTRAHETAEIIAAALDMGVAVDARLRERMNWEGPQLQSLEEFLADWMRTTGDRDARPRFGDSSRQTGNRMVDAVLDAGAAGVDSTVVCVSHGGATTDLLRTVLGDPGLESIRPGLISEGVPGGALTELLMGTGSVTVVSIATTDHQRPEDRSGHRTT